jgi:hypothetical protein
LFVALDVLVVAVVGALDTLFAAMSICQLGAAKRISSGGRIEPANLGGNGIGRRFFVNANE